MVMARSMMRMRRWSVRELVERLEDEMMERRRLMQRLAVAIPRGSAA